MRDGWREVAVGEVAQVIGGGTPKSGVPAYWDGSIPWLTPADLSRRPSRFSARGSRSITDVGLAASSAKLLPAGSVLLSTRAPVGYVTVASAPIATNQGFRSLVLDDSQLPEFWYYLLLNSTDLLRSHAGGSTFQELSGGSLKALRFAIPPLGEQRRIVDLIAAVDDTVEAAEAEAEAARFLYMSQLTSLFANEDSQRRLGSALTRSSEAVKVEPEISYRLVGVLRSGEGLIDRGSVLGGDISYSTLTRVRADQLVYRKLTAWEGPISVATPETVDTFASTEFPVFDVDTTLLLPDLLRHYCRWPGLWDRMHQRIQGTVLRRMRLSPDQLESIEVPMPPVARQVADLRLLDASFAADTAARETAEALRSLRSDLLTVLLSGEHEIPSSYDALLEEAA